MLQALVKQLDKMLCSRRKRLWRRIFVKYAVEITGISKGAAMFLNSSIGISEGVRETLFLRDCRKRNIIHRGGVDIKWNGPSH